MVFQVVREFLADLRLQFCAGAPLGKAFADEFLPIKHARHLTVVG